MSARLDCHAVLVSARWLAALVCAASLARVAHADDDPRVYTDPAQDAVLRRTDAGADGPVDPQAGWPDLLQIVFGGWETNTPLSNPYNGSRVDSRDTNLLRIDLVFNGLVNPPGPINLQSEGYTPYLYGMNPVYGYVEFDLDSDLDTGGEIDSVRLRPLGNVSRFGGRFEDSIGERAALTEDDFDGNLLTAPLVERSGEEMHLAFCACFTLTINPINDPTPDTFDAGDTWIVAGRFLSRTHAFSDYSGAFGGSQPGEYDPIVSLRFQHSPQTNKTTITLVHGLDNSGAAALRGEATQPLDLNAGNQTSILEMLNEIRFAAQHTNDPGPGTPFDLLRAWRDSNHGELDEFLRAEQWSALALVGTTYSQPQDEALYVWTDVGPDVSAGDCTGDGLINIFDQQAIMGAIAQTDGSTRDNDRQPNGQTRLIDFGRNFALYDLDYDGVIGSLDLAVIGYARYGDVNSDSLVNQTDLAIVRALRGVTSNNPLYNPAADLNHDLRIDAADEALMVQRLSAKLSLRP